MKIKITNWDPIAFPWLTAIAYMTSFGIAEFLIYYVSTVSGIVLYFAILFGLILSSAVDSEEDRQRLWVALGLVPLIRIVSIVVPIIEISYIYWYIIIALPVFMGIYTISHKLHYSLDDIGLNIRKPLYQLVTALVGIGLGAIDYFIIKPKPLVEGSFVQLIFPAIVLIICSGLTEELAFRGIMQKAASVLGSFGWIFIAAVYALLQIGNGSVLQIFFIFGVAAYFGFVVIKTKSIVGVSIAHGLMSIMLLLVMPKII
jgi:hypothetical protein